MDKRKYFRLYTLSRAIIILIAVSLGNSSIANDHVPPTDAPSFTIQVEIVGDDKNIEYQLRVKANQVIESKEKYSLTADLDSDFQLKVAVASIKSPDDQNPLGAGVAILLVSKNPLSVIVFENSVLSYSELESAFEKRIFDLFE